jgi:hypothetical protein
LRGVRAARLSKIENRFEALNPLVKKERKNKKGWRSRPFVVHAGVSKNPRTAIRKRDGAGKRAGYDPALKNGPAVPSSPESLALVTPPTLASSIIGVRHGLRPPAVATAERSVEDGESTRFGMAFQI